MFPLLNIGRGIFKRCGLQRNLRFSVRMSSFTKVGSTLVEHKIPLTLYRSTVSGTKIVIVDHPSAMVNAEISFATAHMDDSGLAHTLEHLVFIGSKKYPYAEFLTNLAERSYGYINAFTAFDNTAFSIKTVGAEGFLKLLPVYLDNLLNPLLTESAYITEVHHINGEGQDAGVVYSEMKGRDFREYLKMNELAFGKDSPFAKNLGGDPKVIREICTLDRIKEYHKKFYRMENVFITVVGTVPHEKVLNAVTEFETSNEFKKTGDFVRTYESYQPPEIKKIVERMEIPADGDHGTVHVLWRGPKIWGKDIFPISQLLKYFSSGPESPLYKHYINCANPICSSLHARSDKHKASVIGFTFQGANAEYLLSEKEHIFKEDLLNLLRTHSFDLNRMHNILKRDIEQIGRFLENEISDSIFSDIRLYQDYAPGISTEKDDIKHLASCHIEENEKALTYGEDYWKNLVEKYLTDNYIALFAIPSKELIEREKKEEDERLQKQAENLGPEGLKKCAEILEKAVSANKASQATPELLSKYAVKELKNINIIPVERDICLSREGFSAPRIIHKTGSNFVVFRLLFDGEKIPKSLRPLMRLYMNLINQSSALIEGKLVSCEELSAKRKTDLLSFTLNCQQNKIRMDVMTTLQNLEKAAYWMNVYLDKLVFENPVVERVLKKLLISAEEHKRHDRIIVNSLWNALIDVPDTIDYYYGSIESQKSYKKLLDGLDDPKFSSILIQQLTNLKEALFKAQMNLHLIGNSNGIESVDFNKWPKLIGNRNLINHPEKINDFSLGAGKSYCIARPECTSAYFESSVHAPLNVASREFTYSNLLNMYFCESSGVLHNEVRGKGYAYHVGLSTVRNIGLKLKFADASNLSGAFEITKKCVKETIESGKLDPELFETAKRTQIMRYVNAECTIAQAGENSYNDHMKGYATDESDHQMKIQQINEATADAVLSGVGHWYLDLFDDSKAGRAMVIPPATIEAVQEVFPNLEMKTVDDLCREINIDFDDTNSRL